MQQLQEIALWIFFLGYAIFTVVFLPLGIFVILKDLRDRKKFSTDVREKLAEGIDIDVDLIRYISKARGLKEGAANAMLRMMLSESREKSSHQTYLNLCKAMDDIEPYSDLPAEVRISLIRLKGIVKASGIEYSDEIFQPMVSNLSAYVSLKNDYLRSKKITLFVNIFSFISFLFGAWGIVISISSPNLDQIKSVVENSVEKIHQETSKK